MDPPRPTRQFEYDVNASQDNLNGDDEYHHDGRAKYPAFGAMNPPGLEDQGAHLEDDDDAKQAMSELYPGAFQKGWNCLPVAKRPVRTTQSVSGDANDAAHHDERYGADQSRDGQGRKEPIRFGCIS
jgi:hypothetical protein